jgi:AcrR family transcriptional regulator
MPRPTKQEIDDEIVDRAAALFARHGFKETSVQRIADAVGYSKTGLLHRFPTKEALQDAVLQRFTAEVKQIADEVRHLPTSPDRDRQALGLLADLAIRRPGFIALVLSVISVSDHSQHEEDAPLHNLAEGLLDAFGVVEPECDFPRVVRVIGALGSLAVITVAFRDKPSFEGREQIVAVAYDALGHAGPGAN